MYSCWGKIEGVGVDTHLNRILQRLRWCGEDKREKQMAELESWLPKAMWWDLNEKLLGECALRETFELSDKLSLV